MFPGSRLGRAKVRNVDPVLFFFNSAVKKKEEKMISGWSGKNLLSVSLSLLHFPSHIVFHDLSQVGHMEQKENKAKVGVGGAVRGGGCYLL